MSNKNTSMWSIKITHLSGLLILIIFVIFSYICFSIGIHYQKKVDLHKIQPSNNPSQKVQVPFSACAKQGLQPKSDYLQLYIVKPGDTLLSIAKTQLHDVSRVDELITLNKDRYPDLSLSHSFLEKDWGLFLPPLNQITNGYIFMLSGNIQIYPDNPTLWGVKTDQMSGGVFNVKDIPTNLHEGSCVNVLYQGGSEMKLFSVTPQ